MQQVSRRARRKKTRQGLDREPHKKSGTSSEHFKTILNETSPDSLTIWHFDVVNETSPDLLTIWHFEVSSHRGSCLVCYCMSGWNKPNLCPLVRQSRPIAVVVVQLLPRRRNRQSEFKPGLKVWSLVTFQKDSQPVLDSHILHFSWSIADSPVVIL